MQAHVCCCSPSSFRQLLAEWRQLSCTCLRCRQLRHYLRLQLLQLLQLPTAPVAVKCVSALCITAALSRRSCLTVMVCCCMPTKLHWLVSKQVQLLGRPPCIIHGLMVHMTPLIWMQSMPVNTASHALMLGLELQCCKRRIQLGMCFLLVTRARM